MVAIDSIAVRAQLARAMPENVPSPCVSVCIMGPATGLCEGCWRTLDEIAAWAVMSDSDKRTVWLTIEQRAAAIKS